MSDAGKDKVRSIFPELHDTNLVSVEVETSGALILRFRNSRCDGFTFEAPRETGPTFWSLGVALPTTVHSIMLASEIDELAAWVPADILTSLKGASRNALSGPDSWVMLIMPSVGDFAGIFARLPVPQLRLYREKRPT